LQNDGGISVGNYFSTDKFVDWVHVSVDRPGMLGPLWTDGGADRVGGRGMAASSPELGLRPLRCAKARRRGHKRERGARGARLGPHRSSGGAVEAGRRWCRTERQRRSVRTLLRCGERGKEAGEGVVLLGVVLAFYRGWGSAREGWPGQLTPALMALTPLKTGEGLRGKLREGK
jgi:hypothetical protein